MRGKSILIPMDMTQTDHLRAYGVAYAVLEYGVDVEWLLNYRGGGIPVQRFQRGTGNLSPAWRAV